jgi:hypothetical protein
MAKITKQIRMAKITKQIRMAKITKQIRNGKNLHKGKWSMLLVIIVMFYLPLFFSNYKFAINDRLHIDG